MFVSSSTCGLRRARPGPSSPRHETAATSFGCESIGTWARLSSWSSLHHLRGRIVLRRRNRTVELRTIEPRRFFDSTPPRTLGAKAETANRTLAWPRAPALHSPQVRRRGFTTIRGQAHEALLVHDGGRGTRPEVDTPSPIRRRPRLESVRRRHADEPRLGIHPRFGMTTPPTNGRPGSLDRLAVPARVGRGEVVGGEVRGILYGRDVVAVRQDRDSTPPTNIPRNACTRRCLDRRWWRRLGATAPMDSASKPRPPREALRVGEQSSWNTSLLKPIMAAESDAAVHTGQDRLAGPDVPLDLGIVDT